MDEWLHIREQAELRDHRKVGKEQAIFDTQAMSPGCAFFYPYGNTIYNKLTELMREQYRVRGFKEVLSPNIFNLDLWKTSGHYTNYKDNLFLFKNDDVIHGMKPMNCPAHCLMFSNEHKSYRDLPLRMADFGVLHRNELSGALSGLTRVRRFAQDDAHIFCERKQLKDEIHNSLDFLNYIYDIFGFSYELKLSTRPAPEKRLGSDDLWDEAEKALEDALNEFGKPW